MNKIIIPALCRVETRMAMVFHGKDIENGDIVGKHFIETE